jgi:transcriptional regulator with XRE-family HTH domain
MDDAESSALQTFAAELKAHRTRMDWTQVELGDKIGYSGSFVSDVERCVRTPALDFAIACDREMQTPGYVEAEASGTFERLHELIRLGSLPSWFAQVAKYEREASRIHGWELGGIPGLLQTEDYARAQIRATRPQDDDAKVERLVSARMERQEILMRDSRPALWYVLDEAVLRRVVGDRGVMDAQLERLEKVAAESWCVIQVLKFDSGSGIGADGPLAIYEFPAKATVCYTECDRGGRVIERNAEVSEMVAKLSMIRVYALEPRASVAFIGEVRSQL